MNTNSELDRIVSDWLEVRVVDPPKGSLATALARTESIPQERRGWLPRWLDRPSAARGGAEPARSHDPSVRRRQRFAMSATALVPVLAAIALVAIIDGSGVSTFTVGPDGGDFASIGEAVAAAEEGDIVVIEPGTYEEALIIDKDITLKGSATHPREVVLRVPQDAPDPVMPLPPFDRLGDAFSLPERIPVGVQIVDADATVQDLVVIGQGDGIAMLVQGGAPTLDGLTLKHDGAPLPELSLAGGLFIDGGSAATVRDTTVWYRVRIGGASAPVFSDDQFTFARVVAQDGARPVIIDSLVSGDCSCSQPMMVVGGSSLVLEDSLFTYAGVHVRDGTSASVKGNRFSSYGADVLSITDSATATVVGNSFYGNQQAVRVADASAQVRDNDFVSNWNSILLSAAEAELVDNTIRGGELGISVVSSGSPLISGNLIENAGQRGILVADGTSPVIVGNDICGSDFNLFVAPGADPLVDGNDVCPDKAEPAD